MQTFLPYASYSESAKVLDRQRLGKQRVEAKQIYMALSDPNYGWQNHPAVLMWKGALNGLALYGHVMCDEWKSRGYKDTLDGWFLDRYASPWTDDRLTPKWLGVPEFHASHRQTLLSKNFEWYKQFGWAESPKYEYWWPTKNGY